MGHLPYSEPAPTGYPAQQEDWVNTGAMLSRMTFGLDLAAGRIQGVRTDPTRPSARAGPESVEATLEALIPTTSTTRLATAIGAELETQAVPPRQRPGRVLGLALGSPEFQRR
jgi:hypothetical protein